MFSSIQETRYKTDSLISGIVGTLSYWLYLEKFIVPPDFVFESDFIGFALNHTYASLRSTEDDRKLFSFKGKVHTITATPLMNTPELPMTARGTG